MNTKRLSNPRRFRMKRYQILCILMIVLTLIPMLWAGFYTRPANDDFRQAYGAHIALQTGGSLWDAIQAACLSTTRIYNGWNGVFFSMFLSSFPPFVFGEHLSFVGPMTCLLSILAACWLLFSDLQKLLHFSAPTRRCAVCLTATALICFMKSLYDNLYWFAGAVNYTWMFALSLFLFALTLRWFVIATPKGAWNAFYKTALVSIGTFLLGGGNFSTSTISVVIFGLLGLYQFYRYHRKEVSGKALLVFIPFVTLLIGYFISIRAPGNAYRQAGMTTQPSLAVAVFTAFRYTFAFIELEFSLDVVALLLLFMPVAIAMVRNTTFRFPCPLLVAFLSYLLIVAGFMPPMYSMGGEGPLRLVAIQVMLLYLLLFLNAGYCIGWVYHRLTAFVGKERIDGVLSNEKTHRAAIGNVVLVLCFMCICTVRFTQFYPLRVNTSNNALHTAVMCITKEVQTYAEDYDEMVLLCEQNPGGDIELTPFQACPDIYTTAGITYNAADNADAARYFGVNSIKIIPN